MLTDEQCNEFRRLPMSFNDMVRAIYEAGRASKAAEYADVPHEEWNGEGWESLAWHLCAEENGEDACNRQLSGGAKRRPLERPVRRQR